MSTHGAINQAAPKTTGLAASRGTPASTKIATKSGIKQEVTVLQEGTAIEGTIRNGGRVEIYGYIDGELHAASVIVHPGGKLIGTLHAGDAEVAGTLRGDIAIKNLIKIRSTGAVTGNVRYGQMAMEVGGDLSAQVRNIPPTLGGDLDITVKKGGAVRVTTMDLTAFDPDNEARELTFHVSNANNGFVALGAGSKTAANKFTQADLAAGNVYFVHDGGQAANASFDVIVSDTEGGTSGAPKTVKAAVM